MHVATTLLMSAAVWIGGAGSQPSATARDVADVFTSLYLVYDTARLTEQYRAEHGVLPRADGPATLARALFGDDAAAKYLVDPWGTPVHIESIPGKGYVIATAGSDRRFDRATWSQRGATTHPEDDVVFRDGELIRSPVDWATMTVFSARDLDEAGKRLLEKEAYRSTVSRLRALLSAILTYEAAQNKEIAIRDLESLRRALVPKYTSDTAFTDGWEHPFSAAAGASGRSYVIASAGPDGRFGTADDIILTGDGNIRNADQPVQKSDSAADTDRLLEAYGSFKAALQRFKELRR